MQIRRPSHVTVLPLSLADFICGSCVVEYIRNFIVERNRQEAFIFVTNSVSLNCLSEPCPVGGRKGLDRAYCRTRGSLTMTYGGNERKGVDLKEGMRRRRPVLRSILKLGD